MALPLSWWLLCGSDVSRRLEKLLLSYNCLVTLYFLDDRADSIVCAVESLRGIVLMDKRVLLDCNLPVMTCHHLCHFVFFDFFLSG